MKHASLAYLDHVRGQRCAACGYPNAQPHHLRAVGMGCNRKHPMKRHFTAVPLCAKCHREVEQIGMKKFAERYVVDLYFECLNTLADFIWKEQSW